MAKAKNTTAVYVDIAASDYSEKVQALLIEDRRLYDEQKALRKRIAEAINEEEVRLPEGKMVTNIKFTAWGQLQAVVDVVPTVKAAAKGRTTFDTL